MMDEAATGEAEKIWSRLWTATALELRPKSTMFLRTDAD